MKFAVDFTGHFIIEAADAEEAFSKVYDLLDEKLTGNDTGVSEKGWEVAEAEEA